MVANNFDQQGLLSTHRPHHSQHRRNGQSIHRGNRLPWVCEGSLTSVRLRYSPYTYSNDVENRLSQGIILLRQGQIVLPSDVAVFLLKSDALIPQAVDLYEPDRMPPVVIH